MPTLVPVDYEPYFFGDPEAASAVAASNAMAPVIGDYLKNVLSGEMARRGIQDVNDAFKNHDYEALLGSFGVAPLAVGNKLGAGTANRLLSEGAGVASEAGGNPLMFDWTPGGGSKVANVGGAEITYGVGKDGSAEVSLIRVPRDQRNQGVARSALTQMVNEADQQGLQLRLNAEPMDKGVSKKGLVDLYQSLGFAPNKGKNKDFSTQAEFIRQPQPINQLTTTPENALEPIRAYHGSPHDFDAFDLSKIGTGEGAQAYGHGLYFAEHPETAESYKFAGQPAYMNQNVQRIAQEAYDNAKASAKQGDDIIAQTRNNLYEQYQNETDVIKKRQLQDAYNNVVDLTGYGGSKIGRTYEVNINADPDTFLHWDKPLSEQPEPVRTALEKMLPQDAPMTAHDLAKHFLNTQYAQQFPDASDVRSLKRILNDPIYPEELEEWAAKQKDTKSSVFNLVGPVGAVPSTSTGGQIYERLGNAVESAQALRNAGVSGIKYLDQGSRGAGEGTHNFVVFSPEIIQIVRKYGLAPLLAGGATAISGNADAATHLVPVDYDPFSGRDHGSAP